MDKKGFTLLELLVVVLIIGILAAIALPQYQKAVLKSKTAQLYTSVSAVRKAIHSQELANGEWPKTFDNLEIDLPLEDKTGTVCGLSIASGITKKEGKGYAIIMGYYANLFHDLFGVFTEGKYPCVGFGYLKDKNGVFDGNTLYCLECANASVDLPDKTRGRFCTEVMGKKFVRNAYSWDYFE